MKDVEVQVRAKKIATDAKDVREQTRDLVMDVIRHSGDTLGQFPKAVNRVVDGAREGLDSVVEDRQADVLRDVMDGVSDGLSKGANAVKYTFEEANKRGQDFAKDEIVGTLKDLRALESLFVDRMGQLVKSSVKLPIEQSKDLLSHAQNAAKGIRPAVGSAIEAAEKNPVGLTKETASVAVDATRRVTGSLFQAVAGVIDGVGDAIGGKSDSDK
ncbi:hypothetical protein COB72_00250 [bacterium]|nr:MAG: hypothetical protein COB72_00250 [bacterium]